MHNNIRSETRSMIIKLNGQVQAINNKSLSHAFTHKNVK